MSDEMRGPLPVPPQGYEATHAPVPGEGSAEVVRTFAPADVDVPPSTPSGVPAVPSPAPADADAPASVPGDTPAVAPPASTRVTWGQRFKWGAVVLGIFFLFIVIQTMTAALGMGLAMGFHMVRSVEAIVLETGTEPTDADFARIEREAEQAVFDTTSLEAQVVTAFSQLATLGVMCAIWRLVRRRGFKPPRAARLEGRDLVVLVGGLLVMGLGLQLFLGTALTLVAPFFEEAFAEYDKFMAPAVGDAVYMEFISLAILAPILEEICCRGVMLEFSLRVVCPWSRERGARGVEVTERAFWTANFLQALSFAVLHGNAIQGSYALLSGMLLGLVYWRTGKLRYAMALHFAINASSYLVTALDAALAPVMPPAVVLAVIGVSGAVLLAASWHTLRGVLGARA